MNRINTYNDRAFISLFLFPILGFFALYYSSKARTNMLLGNDESATKYAKITNKFFTCSFIGAVCVVAYSLYVTI
ncbi:MAG: CD225/dispanin family protein [Marinifilaceae bacterium]